MQRELHYLLAADAILWLHVAFVGFVVVGLLLVLAGRLFAWSWVRDPWFRAVHLLAIGIVVVQAWLGELCPLTRWEMALRARAGDAVYDGSFISHWLQTLLYHDAPGWVFAIAYTLFGALVVAAWVWIRPRPFRRSGGWSLLRLLTWLLAVAAVLVFIVPAFASPRFVVVNRTAQDVDVTVHWRAQARRIGVVPGGSSTRFTIDDEAAAWFRVRYPDGAVSDSEKIYFGAGLVIIAEVGDATVRARYDFDD